MNTFNEWFAGLPEGEQMVLADDKWMLASVAYKAGLTKKTEPVANFQCSDGLAQLVTLQEQYIAFIGDELEETAILAAARGWKSKRFDEGVKLRTEMERLKGKLG